MVHRNKAGDCLREPLVDTLPTQCLQLKRGYGDCKRGQIDMRKRFRAPPSISVAAEVERGTERHMLYAGKPAMGDTKGTGDRPDGPYSGEEKSDK
jgi:cytochrome c oxidase assembly factor 5